MYKLPTTIEIASKSYTIRERGDFRMVLDCFLALQDVELDEELRLITAVLIFYQDFNSIEEVTLCEDVQELITKMFWFFNCGEPEITTNRPDYKLIDWDMDSQLIASAINSVANKEIRLESYIHWWTFMGYYNAIGECPLSTVVSIRKKVLDGKKLEKYEQEFKRDNPQYFLIDSRSNRQKELDNMINDLWNKE